MAEISGTTGDSGRLIIIREATYTIEHSQDILSGDYRVSNLRNDRKLVVFRRNDGYSVSYGLINPYQQVTDGALYSCGLNQYGDLGLDHIDRVSNISQVGDTSVWSKVSSSYIGTEAFTFAIKNDGTLWACGSNSNGRLGLNDVVHRSTLTQVGSDNTWEDVSCGTSHTLAIKTDGTLWVWGNDNHGQLGQGSKTNRSTPIQVGSDNDWLKIATNRYTSHALKSDGTRWVWGYNNNRAFGNNSIISLSTPTQIGTDTDWQSICCGSEHCVALKNDNTLWTWGTNTYGQLGSGDTTLSAIPVQRTVATDWVKIRCGEFNTFVSKSNGEVWAVGNNTNGCLAVGSTAYSSYSTFIKCGSDTDWLDFRAGNRHSMWLKNNGTLWVTGSNNFGQFGDGTITSEGSSRVQVGTASDWSSIFAGAYSSFALK